MMNTSYQKTIDFLFAQLPSFSKTGGAALKYSLDNIERICAKINNPQQKIKTIHVAGTNGKGTVSHALASIFQEAGYTTGLFTSPHFFDFSERIKINGLPIDKGFVVNFIEQHKQILLEFTPSFFEYTTAMAFAYFHKQNVDIAIIETGLGGRLDSTNIINSEASIITKIGLDHTEFLGTTLTEIAAEKAGIIKAGKPVISGFQNKEVLDVLEKTSSKLNAALHYVQNVEIDVEKLGIEKPPHFSENFQLVQTTVKTLQKQFPKLEGKLTDGLKNIEKNTGYIGRWQLEKTPVKTIFDVGHNAQALEKNLAFLQKTEGYKNLNFVLGFSNDKEIDDVLALFPKQAHYYCTQADNPRAMKAEVLCEKLQNKGLTAEVIPNVKKALEIAIKKTPTHGLLYVGGSFFVVAEALED